MHSDQPDVSAAPLTESLVALLAALLAARTIVAWTPLLHFDIDPSAISREAVVPFAGMGPAGSMLMDGLTCTVAGILLAMLAHGRCIAWPGALAVAAGMVAALDVGLVLRGDFENLWRGSAWVSAFLGAGALAATGAHARAARLQRIALAVLLSMVAVWIVRGSWQLIVEHPQTVAEYVASKEQFLAAQGWAADSVQAQSYERRLMQREATGWFGLSNIMAGLVGAAGLACGVLVMLARRTLSRVAVSVLLATALASGAILLVNGSKGALASVAIGVAAAWWSRRSSWHARVGLMAALVLPVLAVVARGALGASLHEQSLLFRSHYWSGAWQVMLESWPWGCGPDAFQNTYTLHRPALAVEEVTSAHAAPVDWLATMGVAGVALSAAWVVLMLAGADPGVKGPRKERSHGEAADGSLRDLWMVSLIGLALVGVVAIMADPDGRVLPVIGVVLAACVARSVIAATAPLDDAGWRVLATGVLSALVSHAMVEMTLWQPGSASWVLGTIGAFAVAARATCSMAQTATTITAPTVALRDGICWPGMVASAGVLVIASLQVVAASRTMEQEHAIASAAETLVENLFTSPARARAGDQLLAAYDDHPALRRHLLLLKSADQVLQAATGDPDPARARVMFTEALAAADRAREAFPLRASLVHASIMDAMADRGLAGWDQVVDARTEVLTHDPRHTVSWVRMAKARAQMGDAVQASEAARRALDTDASFRLDPLRQLPAAVRAECERLVAVP